MELLPEVLFEPEVALHFASPCAMVKFVPLSGYTIPLYEQAASPEVREHCQHKAFLMPTGGMPSRLSSQFPGWPTVPLHRMMMFWTRESEPQKAVFPGGQEKVSLLGLKVYCARAKAVTDTIVPMTKVFLISVIRKSRESA